MTARPDRYVVSEQLRHLTLCDAAELPSLSSCLAIFHGDTRSKDC